MSQVKYKNVWSALAAAQGKFDKIQKTVEGHFGKYAPLEAILEVIRPELNAVGIAISTTTEWTPTSRVIDQATGVVTETDGYAEITTRLWHGESETQIYSSLPLPIVENPQQIGKVISYFRRYQAAAVSGSQPEGMDTETGDGKTAGRPRTDLPPSRPQRPANGNSPATPRQPAMAARAGGLMFPPGSPPPDAPSWRQWKEDPVAKTGKWSGKTWGWMCDQPVGSEAYGFLTYMLEKTDLNPGYADKLRSTVYEIESRSWPSSPPPQAAVESEQLKTPEEIPF